MTKAFYSFFIQSFIYWEKLENKIIQSDGFIVKESQRYNVSVLINQHQDFKMMILSVVRSMMDGSMFGIIIYRYLPNPSARAGYDTRSIFKRSLTGLNSEFSLNSEY